MKLLARVFFVVLLTVTVSGRLAQAEPVPPPEPAPSPEPAKPNVKEAKELYKEGMELYQAERYIEAAKKFTLAYEAIPDVNLLYNMARAWDKGGVLDRAKSRYEEVIVHKNANAKQRTTALERLKAISAVLDEAQKRKEAAERAEKERLAEIERQKQAEADRLAEIERQKQNDAQRRAEIERLRQEKLAQEAELERQRKALADAQKAATVAHVETPPDTSTVTESSDGGGSALGPLGTTALILGLATGAVAAGVWGSAEVERASIVKAGTGGGGMTQVEAMESAKNAQTLEEAGIALTVVGGALFIAGIVMLALPEGDGGGVSKDTAAGSTVIAPWFGATQAGLMLEGRF